MSDPSVPTAPPAVPSLDPPPIPGLDELDVGPMERTDEPKPAPVLTPEQQRENLKKELIRQLQEKHPELTDAWLEGAKAKIGRIYILPIFDDFYIIRPLRRGEWKKIMSGDGDNKPMNQDAIEEAITMKATIFPQLDPAQVRSEGLAGVPTAITNYVELISGFKPELGPVLL